MPITVEFNREELYEMHFHLAKGNERLNDEEAKEKANNIVIKREKMLREMAEFMSVDHIKYEDHGKAETYTAFKNGKALIFNVGGNSFDGGYMSCDVVELVEEVKK